MDFEHAPLWTRVEARRVNGHAPWQRHEPGPAEQIYWYRFRETPRGEDGTVDPLALLVLADTMPGAVFERLGPDAPRWLAPSAELTVRFLNPVHSDWVLVRVRAHEASNGYVSLENQLWDAETGALVATAAQLAFFRFLDADVSGSVPA